MLDLFIKYSGNIENIAKEISELLGITLKKQINEFDEDYYMFRIFEIEFVLYGEHGLEDDCGIDFSKFDYQMQILKLRSGEKYKSYNDIYNSMAAFLTEKLSLSLDSHVMLVNNLTNVVLSTIPAIAM